VYTVLAGSQGGEEWFCFVRAQIVHLSEGFCSPGSKQVSGLSYTTLTNTTDQNILTNVIIC
jgi:hypothetical protein